jgi:heme a synthase
MSAVHAGEGSREPARASVASPARRLATWLLLLCALVSVLILWGGIVRLSGAGLAIPGWPLVDGGLLPPFTDSGWNSVHQSYTAHYPELAAHVTISQFQRMFAIEYFHRFLGALVGIGFLALLLRSQRTAALWAAVGKRMKTAGWLLVAQVILGVLGAKYDLKAFAVAANLGLGFWFLGVLLWVALTLTASESGPTLRRPRNRVARLALGSVFLQVVTGGLVAGSAAGLMLNTWPQMGGYWIPPLDLLWTNWYSSAWINLIENQVLVQFIHRWLAMLAALFVIALVIGSTRLPMSSRGRLALRAVPTMLVLQLLLGIGDLLFQVPLWIGVTHLAVGIFLYAALVTLAHELTHPAAAA